MDSAAIYVRISQDKGGTGMGVARQAADCTDLCDRNGWSVVETITDNDVSAYSGKRRPGYERLLQLIEDGNIGVVVAWHPDRLHRRPMELETFVELVERTGVKVATCTAGDIDLSTSEGRLTARITGAVARKESEDKSRRLRRKHLELAESGKDAGGGRRAFGYEGDRVTVRPDEAAAIRDAADRLLAGESLRSIMTDWNERGVKTVTGAKWTRTTVRGVMRSGRISGRREHHGQIVADAVWPAIISPAEGDAIRSMIDSTPSTTAGRTSWRYLLSGMIFCGRPECGAQMSTQPVKKRPRYACLRDRHNGCNRCSVDATYSEEFVVGAVHEALRTNRLPVGGKPRAVVDRQQLADDEAALADLARDRYVDRVISDAEYRAARSPLEDRIRRAQALISAEQSRSAVALAGGPSAVADGWDALTFGQRQAIIAELVDRVTVAPIHRGGSFNPDRLSITWRR